MIYLELFWTFFLIGAFTFGGGYAMLPLIQIEVVNKGWLANEDVINFIAVSESTPGPFAINMSTYVGSEMGGVFGAACATLGVVMPSFIIILIVAKCYDRFKRSKLVKGAMSGLKPAVIGMIGTAVLSLLQQKYAGKGLFLEIESVYEDAPDLALRQRRKQFYLRCGMTPMGVMICLFGVNMELLGFDCKISFDRYHQFYMDNVGSWAAGHVTSLPHPENFTNA